MRILFYRYNSICEPDIIEAFRHLGVEVREDRIETEGGALLPSQKVRHLADLLLKDEEKDKVSFVFSVNFYPYVSELCNKLNILYVCWSVDCPVLELFSSSVRNKCNRIFLFDEIQYQTVYPYNPEGIFYLPLATNPERWDKVLEELTEEDRQKYSADVSFVGSLYHEKSPLAMLDSDILLPDYWKGYIKGVVEAQIKIYGYNFMEEVIPDELIACLKEWDADFYCLKDAVIDVDRYVAAHDYLGTLAAEIERVRTLNVLAKTNKVTVYTRSDTGYLQGVDCRPGVTTHEQMPKVFHLSKINLNITMRPIQSGLSLRVWDILGCGGFCLSNYQSEIPTFLEVGKDIECYESLEECREKVAFYLAHDELRREIAINGYRKVKQYHTYDARLAEMMKVLLE